MTDAERTVTVLVSVHGRGERTITGVFTPDQPVRDAVAAILRAGGDAEAAGWADDVRQAAFVAVLDEDDQTWNNVDYSFWPGQPDVLMFLQDYVTFGDIEQQVRAGYLRGNAHRLRISASDGRGADWGDLDLVSWLYSQGVDVGIGAVSGLIADLLLRPVFRYIRNSRWDRRARLIAIQWARRGLESPWQLMDWIERKQEWTVDEVARRLTLSTQAAERLLRAMGLEPDSRDVWRPGTSKKALRRRQRWEEEEGLQLLHDD